MKNLASEKPAKHWLDAWHVDPSANREYDFIDGLRGVAILMVLFCHSLYQGDSAGALSKMFLHFTAEFGRGVDLFFTISGFLIAWPFWKRKAGGAESIVPPGYGWRRFWKIYPPLALSVLLFTPIHILFYGHTWLFLKTAIQWVTGLAFLMPVSGLLNPVTWSLVVEVHFYLCLPCLFLLTKRLSTKNCLWVIPLVMFVVPVSIQTITGVYPTYTPEIKDPFCTGVSFFCLGVLVAGIDALKLWNQKWASLGSIGWVIILASMVGMAWWEMLPEPKGTAFPWTFHQIFFIGSACLLFYTAAPESPVVRWLCNPWLRLFGIISYEWYLFHQPMFLWTRNLLGPSHGDMVIYGLIIGIGLVASLLFSAMIYLFFSLPLLKYGRSRRAAQKRHT